MPTRPLTILHTSDCHLDADWRWSGSNATNEPFVAFSQVVDVATRLHVDMLIIAGDFFDSNSPSERAVSFALRELTRLSCQTIICPGNHDSLDAGSVYHRVDLAQAGNHVRVISAIDGELIELPDLSTVVWGRAATELDPAYRPLQGLPARDGDRWHVAIAHGHFMEDSHLEPRWGPILASELAQLDWDYLALGHWDHHADVSQGTTRALYSGAPHGLAWPGVVMKVVLDPVAGTLAEAVLLG